MKIMRLIPTFFLLLLFPLSANSQPLSDMELHDLLRNGLLVHSVSNESEMKQYLGDPVDTKIQKVDNPYSETYDVVTQFIYPGIEISFYECRNPENRWKKIVSVAVSSKHYELKYNISLGMKINDIERLFQDRDRQTWDSEGLTYISYSTFDSVHEQINFAIKNGIVQQVIWSNWP
jgi:hypothetical protein